MTAPVFEDQPETARGLTLYRALLAIHALIRRELERVESFRRPSSTGSPQTGFTRSSRC
jgi:hypothetical protein